jgi:transposase
MDVNERQQGDLVRLEALIDRETCPRLRDRYRIVRLAIKGWQAPEIAEALASDRRTVQAWAYRYRDGGIESLKTPLPPRSQRLSTTQRHAFIERLTAGPREGDGVCTLRGKDAQRILLDEFGVRYSLAGVYALMHRLGLSCLKPRPRHERSDPAAMQKFKEHSAPLLSEPSGTPSGR